MSDYQFTNDIAIVGMACRYPNSPNLDAFWRNLRDGVECIRFFSDDELRAGGVPPHLLADPDYVNAYGYLEGIDRFDAAFFGYTPREAESMDPQHRLFLECAWEALEHAGYTPERFAGAIGIYGGAGRDTYYVRNVLTNPALEEALGQFQTYLGNDKDFLTTRVSYKLNLTGPSVSVQTACSTSLVAIHLACQNLLDGECDLALAGGVSVVTTGKEGYRYTEGGVNAPDGHCRPFSARAQGMVGGDGVGLVVLKRLEDALAGGDAIHAVVKGTAVNNDGADKVGYTAPSVGGQAAVIAEALAMADVHPETISYVEAHGTATPLGDPIEVAALTQAFRERTDEVGFCALGSVKSNIGHTNTAAGVAGVIKTVLAMKHGLLPPTLHYDAPNPEIDFAHSPFVVNDALREWPQEAGRPRRAGVSAFGIGGTNAHVVLEEAPPSPPAGAGHRRTQVLTLSAKTATALEAATGRWQGHPRQNLADAAYTLHVGRAEMRHRRAVVLQEGQTWDEAVQSTGEAAATPPPVIFMFPGQGAQHANMGRDLYETEPAYRAWIDRGATFLSPKLGLDVRTLLYPPAGAEADADAQLRQTALTQPVLFVVGHALARVWQAWGVHPAGMIGHSVGEVVAACLAGVFTWQEALQLLVARGRLIQALPAGAMLAVPLAEDELRSYLGTGLDVAAVNGPEQVVVAGDDAAITALAERLAAGGIDCQPLATSHAFHSAAMDAILPQFAREVARVDLRPPSVPVASTVTGAWLTAQEATDPDYWVRHVRQTVRFAAGLETIATTGDALLLDVGPGKTVAALARRHPATRTHEIVASCPHPRRKTAGDVTLQRALGALWCAGVAIDWDAYHAQERRRRVPLPTYPFERQRYWSEPQRPLAEPALTKKPDLADWLYLPSWQRTPPRPGPRLDTAETWLIFAPEEGDLADALTHFLRQNGQRVSVVSPGDEYRPEDGAYRIRPGVEADYDALLRAIIDDGGPPRRVLHLWGTEATDGDFADRDLAPALNRYFYSFFYLARALSRQRVGAPVTIIAVTAGLQDVTGDETIRPETGVMLGPVKVLPLEFEAITCLSLDVTPALLAEAEPLADRIVAEALAPVAHTEAVVAYRGRHRWRQTFVAGHAPAGPTPLYRDKGVYLITGGTSGVGLALAEQIARSADRPCLVLLSRSGRVEPAQRERLEALGATVHVIVADVTDEDRMQTVWAKIQARWGRIDGVIHAAGLGGGGAALLRTPEQVAALLAPKVQGTQVLARLLREQPPDFFLLCSSLAATLGGFGQIDYCAANAFLEVFALHEARRGRPTTAVAWDIWNETGMATTELPQNLQARRAIAARTGMSRAEGMAALLLVLRTNSPNVFISTVDLPRRYREQFNVLTAATESASAHAPAPEATAAPAKGDGLSPIEQEVAAIWRTLFGLPDIGPDDDFFALGGHSLLATQLLNRLRRDFPQASLSLSDVFERPTVAGIAALIGQDGTPAERDWQEQFAPAGSTAAQVDLLATYLHEWDSDTAWATLVQTPEAVAELIWALKRDWDFPLYPHEVRARTGRRDLAAYLAQEMARQREPDPQAPVPTLSFVPEPLQPATTKNPTAIFLLSAPRSGSTLLRLMLAGHPHLFAPPELGLLSFATAGAWLESQRAVTARTGYEEALLALGMDEAEVTDWLEAAVANARPVQALYRHLQRNAAPRILVDKTPGYAIDLAVLQRAETIFADPRYIALVRHPYAVVDSFVRQRMHAVLGQETANPYGLGEQVWQQWNENILAFRERIAPERFLFLTYETLVREPQSTMEEIAAFLGLPFAPATLRPYQGERMIGGLGDPDILQHDRIDATLADAWRDIQLPLRLNEATQHLAHQLGYELSPAMTTVAPTPTSDPASLLAQLDQLSDADVDRLLETMLSESVRDQEN